MNYNFRIIAALLLSLLLLVAIALPAQTNGEKEKLMEQFHQDQAVKLFNTSWDLLLKENRTRNDEDTLINMVHASLHHWRQIGEPINVLRGEWMICHVYTLLKHKEEALYHAENVLRIMEEIKPVDWDLAYCYEAMARVQALLGNKTEFDAYYALALQTGKKIAEDGDKLQFEADLNDANWFGMK